MLLIWAHQEPSAAALTQKLQQGLRAEGLMLQPGTPLQAAGPGISLGNFQGFAQGQMVYARVAGVSFSGGGGVYVVGLANPQVFQQGLITAVDQVARTVKQAGTIASGSPQVAGRSGSPGMGSPAPGQFPSGSQSPQQGQMPQGDPALLQRFAGTWKTNSKSTETTLILHPNGTYEQLYTAGYSGNGWGTARDDRERGRWQVQGTLQQGTLIFTDSQGSSQSAYRVHSENGQVYWSEYWVDGELWSKQ
jgi:hypothetical protein